MHVAPKCPPSLYPKSAGGTSVLGRNGLRIPRSVSGLFACLGQMNSIGVSRGRYLPLIPDRAQEAAALLRVFHALQARRTGPVDYTDHAAALLAFHHDRLHRVRGRAENAADLRD